jgi:beta-glucanase (GH16 family)
MNMKRTITTMAVAVVLMCPAAASAMTYKFADEFNGAAGSAPNSTLWGYETGRWTDNGELETYTNSRANSYQDGQGNLVIKAIKSASGGRRSRNTYTSARLTTQNKFSSATGSFEARIKVDLARGTWPAFWAIGSDYNSVGWPQCGEIDGVEVYGQPGWNADSTVHTAGSGGADVSKEALIPGGVDAAWHVYRWTIDPVSGSISFYKDPIGPSPSPYLVVKKTDLPNWPFGVSSNPSFLILNLAVGGDGGGTVPSNFTSSTMLVDYVRAW